MSWQYILALVVNCLGILVAVYFVITDSFKAYNTNSTLGMVTFVFCAWVGISFFLYHHGHPRIASSMAWVTAIPLLGYGFFVLLFILLKPDMR